MKFDDVTIEGSAEIKRKLFLGEFDPLFSGKCKIDGDLVVNGRIINNDYVDNTSVQHSFSKLIIEELEGKGEIKINTPITVPIIYPKKIFLEDSLIEKRNNRIEINEKIHCPSLITDDIKINELIGNKINIKEITTHSLLSGDIQTLNINTEKINSDNAIFKNIKVSNISLPDDIFISHLICNTINGIKLPVDEILTLDKKQPLNNKFLINPFDANKNRIINLAEPTMPNDCATKSYVDKYLGTFKIYQSVAVLFSKTDELKGEVLDNGGIITIKFPQNIKIDGIPFTEIREGDRIMVLDKIIFKNGVLYPEIYTILKYKRLSNSHNYILILEFDNLFEKINEKYIGIKVLNGMFYSNHTIIYHKESKVITWI